MGMRGTLFVSSDLLAGMARLIEPSRIDALLRLVEQHEGPYAEELQACIYAALPPGCMAERDYRGLHRLHRWFLGEMERILGNGPRTVTAREIGQWMNISEAEATTIRRALQEKGLLATTPVSKGLWSPHASTRQGRGWSITPRGRAVLEWARLQQAKEQRTERTDRAEVVQLLTHA